MITKENYEEYFLLYIDNELSPAARGAVEKFVEENPQLQEEWEALLQCRVDADRHVVFPGKEALFHEDLLSYVDGELSEERRSEVEAFVRQHPAGEVELQQLLMTVSHPDRSVCFPDKESLYRTERRRRILLMPWMQAGIAAAVLGIVALLLLTTRHGDVPVVVKAAPTAAAKTDPDKKDPPAVVKAMPETGATKATPDKSGLADAGKTRPEIAAAKAMPKTATAKTTPNKIQPRTVTPATRVPLYSSGNADHNGKKEVDVVTKPQQAALAKTSDSPPGETALEITPDAGQKTIVRSAVADVTIPKEQSSFATQALLQEAGADETKESFTAAPAGKNKLRGIFRRVSRTFGKTAEHDNDGQKEVLISAFQVALK